MSARAVAVVAPHVALVDPPARRQMPPGLGAPWSKRFRLYVALVEAGGRASARALSFALDLSPRQVGAIAASIPGVLRSGPKWDRVYVLEVA